ncbi:MAG: hypothetical protein WC569_00720 [Candidatus Omnitrophota bacterium]
MKSEFDIFYYIGLYKKEARKIGKSVLWAICIILIISFIQPMVYKSTVTVLAPKDGAQMGGLSKYLGLPDFSLGDSSSDIIFSILKSRRMREDINERFNSNRKRRAWWALDTYTVTGGFALEIKCHDPELSRDIANFAIENLDKINFELQITPNKPMVKVLDAALKGAPAGRDILKKIAAGALFVLLFYSFLIFFREYLSALYKKRVSGQ